MHTVTIHPPSQYFVEPPFAAIIAASLLGYVSMSLAHLATAISAHSSRQNAQHQLNMASVSKHCQKSMIKLLPAAQLQSPTLRIT